MRNINGPEDSVEWKKQHVESNSAVIEFCQACKKEIKFWHCADAGCCWCAQCGVRAKATVNGK